MRSNMHIAVLCALATAAIAAPMKRDATTDTVTEIDLVTETVTEIVWVDPTPGPVSSAAAYTVPAVTTHATPATSSPVYIAPAPPSTSTTQPAPTTSSSSTSTPQAVVPATVPQPAAPVPTTTATYVAPPAPTTSSTSTSTSTSTTSSTSTSTTDYVAATPAWVPTTTSTAVSAASSGSSASANKYSGDLTFYDVGLGSCGESNTDSEMVLAMAVGVMNKATMCGKTITISYGGNTHQGTIVDTCMGCADGAIDVSPALFKAVAPSGDGRVHNVDWWFN